MNVLMFSCSVRWTAFVAMTAGGDQSNLRVSALGISCDGERKDVRTMIMPGDVECHALLANAADVDVGEEHRRLLVHWAGEIRAVRGDDRASAAQYPVIRRRHFFRMRLELRGQCRRPHHGARREDEAPALERILSARHLMHLVHCGPERDVN